MERLPPPFSSLHPGLFHCIATRIQISNMVKVIPYIVSLLALGQAVATAKVVSSFSQWVDGILEDPQGDNMTPEQVISAYQSGQFDGSPSGMLFARLKIG